MNDIASIKTLVVEDDLISSTALALGLKKNGFEVVDQLQSADELTDICSSLQPDVILLDIMLDGEKDGVTAAEELRESSFRSPILFLSALTTLEMQDRIGKLSNAQLLSKPYDITQIISTIASITQSKG